MQRFERVDQRRMFIIEVDLILAAARIGNVGGGGKVRSKIETTFDLRIVEKIFSITLRRQAVPE